MVTEARGQEEVQKQSPHLPAPSVDSPRLDVQKIPAAEVTLSRAFPGREIPTGDAVRSGGEAPAVSKDPPAVRHCPQERLPAQTPGGASPDGVGAADPAFSPVFGRRGEEKCSVPQSSLPGTLCCYTGIREVAGGDTEVEESEAPSCSEGENEPEAAVEQGRPELAAPGAAAAAPRPSTEVGYLTSALRDFNISALSEMDRLSTSEVVMFLESCQLRDYSSGDSVSECSSKGTRNKGVNKELKQSEPSGDTYGKQLCEEETLETSEEWVESEEEDGPLRSPSRLAQCSLETLSEVLTRMGRELQTPCEDADEGDAAEVLLLNVHDSVTAEHEEELVPPQETASLSPQPSAAPPPGAGSDSSGPSPTSGGADHENARGRSEGHLDVIRSVDGGEEVPPEPTDPLLLCADSGAGEGEAAFQCQISTVTSEIINVLINKDHNLVIEKGDNWTIINGVALMPNVDQFCAATPKHALPVPGRLPAFAPAHPAAAAPSENSVKILDTMYPELSARARTLSILKGNVQLARGPPADGRSGPGPVSAIAGFKAITSASTAFVKTGGSAGADCKYGQPRDVGQDSGGKRTLSAPSLRSAKRLRLDGVSPEPEPTAEGVSGDPREDLSQAEAVRTEEESSLPAASTASQVPLNPKETVESHDRAIADALRKIAESSFDLLPVIRSHVYVGNISKKPVMRDQEKDVVYEFSTTKKHLAECLLHSILSELKTQKTSVEHSYIHALCRVYVGICRQLGDLERARLFCYSLLKEDFPESEKLTLFIANMWHDVFISQSVINKAMQLVARQRAKGEVLNCLRAFLNWEKNAPIDVGIMVSKLLLTIQLCPKTEFQTSERFGEDLSDNTWEYICAIDLLCCHQKWIWTHDNIISKELWPVMDKWIKYRKGHANIAYTPDIIIASILRLIGRLGQLGLKEGFPSAVKNISAVIGMFIQHAQDEDIPWGIQLAAVYALCDLSPSNPAEISKILEAWRRETAHSVPSAVVGYLQEVSALCADELA
ncbi:Little elongation complex subunit 1 [Camelus dromedarius]|uniref:Little elongation complex subunit 1 n=1 Tax=Camelus dromedarius TaxID=9838 RepID=A0A5N4EE04_CAMDR|nr:Little elongation complex subunit 1 [Camelus dromedarius]